MTIDINQYQSISINRLILIIDDQSMAKIRVVIDWYRFPITIDRLIDIDWYRLVVDCHVSKSTSWPNRRINITSLNTLIVNTFYFDALNVNRTILSSFSYYNGPKESRGSTSSDCRWLSCPGWLTTLYAFPHSPLFLLAVKGQRWYTLYSVEPLPGLLASK